MLPQRRKTAEEIAKLREAMGLPGAENPDEAPQETPAGDPGPAAPEPEPPPPPRVKQVKSLRKSERIPLSGDEEARRKKSADGVIPVRKRTEQELMDLRRQTAAPPEKSIAMLASLGAPWWIILATYLLTILAAFIGWSSMAFHDLSDLDFPAQWIADLYVSPSGPDGGKWLMVVVSLLALALAGWIAWKKPRSRHHAGFVTIIIVLVVTFGIIYHQPLPNGP
ncbi:MAG: hypothetical protein JWO82_3820 [Akkermansiaceae bacterium]|nr:hypothetical protein [Akkermansiaceae bacterium]